MEYKENMKKLFLVAISSFSLGLFLGFFSHRYSFYLGVFLNTWQSLIGSLIGAATPLVALFIRAEFQKKQNQKEHLYLLEKNIITAINNLSDLDILLHAFQSNQLARFKKKIDEDDAEGRWCVGQTFIPLSYTFSFDNELLKQRTNSSYIENLVMQIINISKDIPILLQDVNRQFDNTINLNTEIGLKKLSIPKVHNQTLRENVKEFENFLELQVFGNNIPVYLRLLVQTRVAIRLMIDGGLKNWKRTFNFSPPFSEEIAQKMTEYFSVDVNKQIVELQKSFKSKLLLVGEIPKVIY